MPMTPAEQAAVDRLAATTPADFDGNGYEFAFPNRLNDAAIGIGAAGREIATTAASAAAAKASQDVAKVSQDAAKASETAAAGSATAAGTARTGSEGARDAAVTARQGAESARDTAQGHRTAAGNSATAAAGSATAAGDAKTAAETARNSAATAQTGSETARDTAVAAQAGAEAARDVATTARDVAIARANDAATAQTAAKGSADSAAALAASFEIDVARRSAVPPIFDWRPEPEVAPASPLSFARNTAAWRFNRLGLLAEVASGVLRHSYDRATGAYRGALFERESRNLILHSHDFSAASWSANAADVTVSADAAMALDGSNTAEVISSPTAFRGVSLTNPITLTPGAWVASSIFRLGTATEHRLRLIYSGGPQLLVGMRANGTLFVSGDNILSSGLIDLGSGVWRLWVAFTLPEGAGYNALRVEVTNNSVVGSWTQLHVQLEPGDVPSTPILTTGAATTRAADLLTAPLASTGFNAAEGTVVVRGRTPMGPGSHTAWRIDAGPDNNRLFIRRNPDRTLRLIAIQGGATSVDISLGVVADSTEFAVSAAWRNGDFAASLNGAVPVTAAGVLPTGLATERFGPDFQGTLARVVRWPRRLSNADLQATSRRAA